MNRLKPGGIVRIPPPSWRRGGRISEEYIPLFRRWQRVMTLMVPEFERILNGDVVSGIVGVAILER